MFRRKETRNLLDMIPVLKPGLALQPGTGNEPSEVVIPRTGLLERFSIRWLGQPDRIRVRLDRLGSFVLSRCDGSCKVGEIAHLLEERFGEEASPVLPRLVKFMEILEANGWIEWKEERG